MCNLKLCDLRKRFSPTTAPLALQHLSNPGWLRTWRNAAINPAAKVNDAVGPVLVLFCGHVRKRFPTDQGILKAIIAQGVKLVVLGRGEKISDLPEYKAASDIQGLDALARYLDYSAGMKLLVVGEENVLADPRDMYVGDNQLVRVFARAIHQITGARPVDPQFSNRGRNVQQYELRVERMDDRFDARLKEVYEKALAAGKWKGTSAVHDRVQYWTAGVLAYFDALGQDGAPNDAAHPIRTRELLAQYDPELYALVHETMAYGGKVDWRYAPYRR